MRSGLLALAIACSTAQAGELVFVAATNHAEPLSRFEKGSLSGGIVKDVGDLLAAQLGLRPRYLTRPAKRAPDAVREGEADLICYSRPEWIGRDGLHWTPMFIVNAEVVASHAGVPPLHRLEDLKGQRVGTVLGYVYGDTELRGSFQREDAPDMAANLRKLAARRAPYALTDLISLQAAQRDEPTLQLALRLERFEAGCALSNRSHLTPAAVDAAVRSLVRRGEIERVLARYR